MTEKRWQDFEAKDLNEASEALRKLLKSLSLVDAIFKLAKHKDLEQKEVEYILELFYEQEPHKMLESIASDLDRLAARLKTR